MSLLEVHDLAVRFPARAGRPASRPVDGVSFSLDRGETLALVGESGSGKSLTGLALLGLLPPPGELDPASRVTVSGVDLRTLDGPGWRRLRGGIIGTVFQDPAASLDPVHSAGAQVIEAIRAHRPVATGAARRQAAELFAEVGLEPDRLDAYPHQLSGGQRQRVMIAIALAAEPDLLLADEPTSALDVTVQAQILELLDRLQARRGLAVLLITHDLAIVAGRADRVAVLYAGQVVESGPAPAVLDAPSHPYTRALLAAIPRLDTADPVRPIPGAVPRPHAWPTGCRFHPRCDVAFDRCGREVPPPVRLGAERESRCWLAGEAP